MERPMISSEDVLIRAQDTPNPNAIKFVTNFSLKDVGNATFTNAMEAQELPLIKDIFNIPGVQQVYVFQNTLTVTHAEELPPEVVKDQVKAVITTRLPIHNPAFESPEDRRRKEKPDRSHLSPELRQIEEILDRTIRPGLQSDGGDIEVIEFKDNQLKILYQGACGGCPSSMMGTLDAIQNILRNEMQNDEITVIPL